MPITISGTTVTFNDSSTQTTNVPNATAALSVGAVGTYAALTFTSNSTDRPPGTTVAGSSLRYVSFGGFIGNGPTAAPGGEANVFRAGASPVFADTPSGTWRLMGDLPVTSSPVPTPKGVQVQYLYNYASLWLRIS